MSYSDPTSVSHTSESDSVALADFGLSEHDAEDVFQEVFARTYEHLDSLRNDAAIKPFIAQTARRLAIDRHRAMDRVEPREDATEGVAEVDDVLDRLDEALTVREALTTLPDNCQEILDRFFARDENYRTIADALDIPSGTIARRRVNRSSRPASAAPTPSIGARGTVPA